MSDVISIFAGIAVALVAIKVFQFFNVTVWQCKKFGNCPGWWPERGFDL